MKTRTVYLVYRQREYYDGGMQPYMVFGDEPEATQAAEKMNGFHRRLRERIERLDVFEDGISDDEYGRRSDKRQRMLDRARWPFGISLTYDINDVGPIVAVMPLPARGVS